MSSPSVLVSVALLLLVTACGSPSRDHAVSFTDGGEEASHSAPDPRLAGLGVSSAGASQIQELGACGAAAGGGDLPILFPTYFQRATSWVELRGEAVATAIGAAMAAATDAQQSPRPVSISLTGDGVTALRGPVPNKVDVTLTVASRSVKALDEGALLILGIESADGENWSDFVGASFPDGTVGFVGDCAYAGQTLPFLNYSLTAGQGGERVEPAVLLKRAARSQQVSAAIVTGGNPSPKTPAQRWRDTPASLRSVTDPTTPENVRAELTPRLVKLSVPESWRSWDVLLCTRVDAGWNECVPLAMVAPKFEMTPLTQADGQLQFWLLPPDGRLDEPINDLGSIQVAQDADATLVKIRGSGASPLTARATFEVSSE